MRHSLAAALAAATVGTLAVATPATTRGWLTVPATSPLLAWQGRTLVNDDMSSRSFSWPGVRFSAVFRGASFMTLQTMMNNTVARAKVLIDGMEASWTYLSDSLLGDQYLLFTGFNSTDPTPHNITLIHTSEPSYQGSLNFFMKPTIVSITTDGELLPPPQLPRALEFVGDSLTVGYGANGVAPCPGTLLSEDNSVTWGNLLCERFNANCSIIAWSGIGMYENSRGEMYPETMPGVYTRTLGAVEGPEYDFTSFSPDAVVINLG